MPISTATRPAPKVRLPHQSIVEGVRTPVSRSRRYAQMVPKTPKGTLIQNTARHWMSARRPPTTRPMKEPKMAAIMLIPMAMPRSCTGKASVRIAV